jgi:hypothetical protein
MTTLTFCALLAAPLLAQDQMRPGRWEVTTQVDIDGIPVKIPATTATSCVTPEQARNPAETVGDPSGRGRGNSSCKAADQKVDGNKVTWKTVCTGANAMTGDGEMVFSGDSYTGKMNMAMAQMPAPMTIQLTGKRVGDCEK